MRALTIGAALFALWATVGGNDPVIGAGPDRSTATATAVPADPPTDLVLIAPGTEVGRTPPPGWSHLVIKSVPRLATGDLDTLPETASETATLFRTVVLADVRPVGEGAGRRFVLRRVGLGLCVPVRGRDTVVNTRSLGEQGVELGFVARTVLGHAEQELRRGRLVARTSTFALYSGPTLIRSGAAHREILLRYAMLVDPATGALRTAVWPIDRDPAHRSAPRSLVLLPPALIDECDIDVIADRLFGSVPVNWSFAMRALPPGRTLPVPDVLRPWCVREARGPAESGRFEDALREALGG